MTESLEAALRDMGCTPAAARRLSTRLRVERPGGSRDWLLMLENHGTGYPADRDEVAYAVEHPARNVAADNAEAVDRTARGEPGWTPYWAVPDRVRASQDTNRKLHEVAQYPTDTGVVAGGQREAANARLPR